ncbi:MAG: DUF4340 domain-containing protein [Hyphomicrobium sp.]
MKPQQFAALAAAALFSFVLAVTAYTASAPWQGAVSQGPLLPGFTEAAKQAARMEISQGSSSVVLERKGEQWTLKDRDGYPANSEKVRTLLSGLSTAERVEPKTRKPERYTELEVEDPATNTANSHLLRLLGEGGGVIAELIVGKKSTDAFGASRAGTFVRKPGEDQTWLVDAGLDASSNVKDWVKPRIFETQANRIRKIRLEIPGEDLLEIGWDAATRRPKMTSEVPKGKRIKYANAMDEIADALTTFDLDDVRKAQPAGSDPVAVANVEIDGGLKVSVKIRETSDGDWMTLTATGDGEPKKFADDLTAAVKDWEFKLPRGKADEIFKKRADLLEDDTVDTEQGPGLGGPTGQPQRR